MQAAAKPAAKQAAKQAAKAKAAPVKEEPPKDLGLGLGDPFKKGILGFRV